MTSTPRLPVLIPTDLIGDLSLQTLDLALYVVLAALSDPQPLAANPVQIVSTGAWTVSRLAVQQSWDRLEVAGWVCYEHGYGTADPLVVLCWQPGGPTRHTSLTPPDGVDTLTLAYAALDYYLAPLEQFIATGFPPQRDCQLDLLGQHCRDAGAVTRTSGTADSLWDYDGRPALVVGVSERSRQYAVLGQWNDEHAVWIDADETHAVGVFGTQNSGKSYTLGVLIENLLMTLPNLNQLRQRWAGIYLHFDRNVRYAPEVLSITAPNDDPAATATLAQVFHGQPHQLAAQEVVLLAMPDKVAQRQREYPDLQVLPLTFTPDELDAADWQSLLGVEGNPMYLAHLRIILRTLRKQGTITVDALHDALAASSLSSAQQHIVATRLGFCAAFVRPGTSLQTLIRPGRLLVIDGRDELNTRDEVLRLFTIALNVFARNTDARCGRVAIVDEAHKYMHGAFVEPFTVAIRQMRHDGASVIVSTQDPKGIDATILSLLSVIVLHQCNSPQWLKALQASITAFGTVRAEHIATLAPGEALVWAKRATVSSFSSHPQRVTIRPRATKHGGATLQASQYTPPVTP